MTDIVLTVAHHWIVFLLVAVFAAEFVLLRGTLAGANLLRLGKLDAAYGALAGSIIVVGFLRVFLGAKGSAFFLPNPVFWLKIGTFVVVGLMSIGPTIRIASWRRQVAQNPGFVPPAAQVQAVQRAVAIEALLLVLIPFFAALMARGIGHG